MFEECYKEGVLSSDTFWTTSGFSARWPSRRTRTACAFFAAKSRLQDMARLRLGSDPEDASALFAMTLRLGMQADYTALIEKRQLESLSMIGEADTFARKLLAVDPDAADAYLTLGTQIT